MVITGYARQIAGPLTPADVIDPALVEAGDPATIAAACLATVDPTLAERAREGDLLLLDGSLAGGEGAEAAVIALQAVGFAAVVCVDADEGLRALGATYGLPVIRSGGASLLADGDLLRLDLERGVMEARGLAWGFEPLGPDALAAVRRGQLMARMRRVVEDEGFAE